MRAEKFEDLIVWQKSRKHTMDVYRIFEKCRDFSFKDQIQRASISIMNNIAEGFERKTNKEFIQFLYIAKGSAGEVRSMLYIAEERNYICEEEKGRIYSELIEISRLLAGLIKSLKAV